MGNASPKAGCWRRNKYIDEYCKRAGYMLRDFVHSTERNRGS